MYRYPVAALTLLAVTAVTRADVAEEISKLADRDLTAEQTRAAWDRLASQGPEALLPILRAWPSDDPVTAHWLRTAFDQIVKENTAAVPPKALLDFVLDRESPGKARRAALSALERIEPGTTSKLLDQLLNDPEFGPDAVEARLDKLESMAAEPKKQLLKETFQSITEVEQALAVAKELDAVGVEVDLIAHLGIVRHWHVIGPLPVSTEDGLAKGFPPEQAKDVRQPIEFGGKTLEWKPAETSHKDGRLDLAANGINPNDGAVAYATATVKLDKPANVELRASAVDNITVWVNGRKVVDRASEYRSMYRADRYRSSIPLPAGESTILVKLCKTEPEEVRGKPGRPVRWDFSLRLLNENGQAVPITQK